MKNKILIHLCLLALILVTSSCTPAPIIVDTPTEPSLPSQEIETPATPENDIIADEVQISSITVPVATAPTIDGTMSPGEWDTATIETFADGSELFLQQAHGYLYLGIRANDSKPGVGNVFIHTNDEISILHVSAALGTAVYQQIDGSWQQVRNFDWRCRGTSNSESAQAELAEFFQDEGWQSVNGFVGTPTELEYQVKIPDQEMRLAVIYMKSSQPYENIPWPADLDDDTVKPAPSGLPLEMNFMPDQWIALDFSG